MLVGYDLDVWEKYGLKRAIEIEIHKFPHLLITGASGSGKSYALKWLLKNLVQNQEIKMTFCNFKDSSDFRFLKECGCCYYYTVDKCKDGFDMFYQAFKEAQANGREYNGIFHLLIFDEFPAFITWLSLNDKKTATTIQGQLAEILMLARSYGYGVFIVCQRPDAAFFGSGGAKDNFFVTLALGNLSKEGKTMMFSGYDFSDKIFGVGEGIIKIDGKGCQNIKFPRITSQIDLEDTILLGLSERGFGN